MKTKRDNPFLTGFKRGASSDNSWFLPALFLIFLTLKLTNTITLSWWWVTAPMWVPLALALIILLIGLLLMIPHTWSKK